MNEGIHLDLDTWIVPGHIRKANLCWGVGNRYTSDNTEVLISAVAHNTPPPLQAAQNATTVNTRSSVAPCTAQSLYYYINKVEQLNKIIMHLILDLDLEKSGQIHMAHGVSHQGLWNQLQAEVLISAAAHIAI